MRRDCLLVFQFAALTGALWHPGHLLNWTVNLGCSRSFNSPGMLAVTGMCSETMLRVLSLLPLVDALLYCKSFKLKITIGMSILRLSSQLLEASLLCHGNSIFPYAVCNHGDDAIRHRWEYRISLLNRTAGHISIRCLLPMSWLTTICRYCTRG